MSNAFPRGVLVTGVAGFIGFHLANALLDRGVEVIGIDNINAYYDTELKKARLAQLQKRLGFRFEHLDLTNHDRTRACFGAYRATHVVHLAAQAGVRYSLEAPSAYIDSNVVGTMAVLESCRQFDTSHLLFASSSSVYGGNKKLPFAEGDPVDHPISLYAATKRANELMAHTYSHLYALPTTGLRLFTVYGPWGRPDMAYYRFACAIREGQPIRLHNYGEMRRDFTYVDDVVEAIVRLLSRVPGGTERSRPDRSSAPFRLYNVGNGTPIALQEFVSTLAACFKIKANIETVPIGAGEVEATWADIAALRDAVGYTPHTALADGLDRFVTWFDRYHGRRST